MILIVFAHLLQEQEQEDLVNDNLDFKGKATDCGICLRLSFHWALPWKYSVGLSSELACVSVDTPLKYVSLYFSYNHGACIWAVVW